MDPLSKPLCLLQDHHFLVLCFIFCIFKFSLYSILFPSLLSSEHAQIAFIKQTHEELEVLPVSAMPFLFPTFLSYLKGPLCNCLYFFPDSSDFFPHRTESALIDGDLTAKLMASFQCTSYLHNLVFGCSSLFYLLLLSSTYCWFSYSRAISSHDFSMFLLFLHAFEMLMFYPRACPWADTTHSSTFSCTLKIMAVSPSLVAILLTMGE